MFLLVPIVPRERHDGFAVYPQAPQRGRDKPRISDEKPIVSMKRHWCAGVDFSAMSGVHADDMVCIEFRV
jgi:hypothetical protein